MPGDHGYTTETAGHFFTLHVKPRWEAFLAHIQGWATSENVPLRALCARTNDQRARAFVLAADGGRCREPHADGCHSGTAFPVPRLL